MEVNILLIITDSFTRVVANAMDALIDGVAHYRKVVQHFIIII